MDFLPNELLTHIIDCLDLKTLKTGRLINSRWNILAGRRMKRYFHINIGSTASLLNFTAAFGKNEVNNLAVTSFLFSGSLPYSTYAMDFLNKFCVKYGHIVTELNLDGSVLHPYPDWSTIAENPNKESELVLWLNVLLKHCENIEELTVVLPKSSTFEGCLNDAPIFHNLHKISISFQCNYNSQNTSEVSNCFVSQIASRAPLLSNVVVSSAPFFRVAKMMSNLRHSNAKATWTLNDIFFSREDSSVLEKLIDSESALRICEIALDITRDSSDFLEILSAVSKLLLLSTQSLKKLCILCCSEQTSISLPALPALEHLDITNVMPVPASKEIFHFPQLRILSLSEGVDVTFFSGSIFHNVKKARISIRSWQAVECWPNIIPNVENMILYVDSDKIHVIFEFPKLVSLNVWLEEYGVSVRNPKSWEELTGGAQEISDDVICTIPLEKLSTANNTGKSFQNLTRLRQLEFVDGKIDCWKAVIYASRTGQLHRLQKLTFGNTHEYASMYSTALESYHDVVDRNFCNDIDLEDEEDTD